MKIHISFCIVFFISAAFSATVNLIPGGDLKTLDAQGRVKGWAMDSSAAVVKTDPVRGRYVEIVKPGKGIGFSVKLDPSWGVLTLNTSMKTDGLVIGEESWRNGRIPMSFYRADGTRVGAWPNVFGFEGTQPWTNCQRDFPIPAGAVELRLALHHFGTKGSVSFGPISLVVKRNRADRPSNVPLPEGAPSDPWSLKDAWRQTTGTRTRYSLNGLWGLRPVMTNETDAAAVPGQDDNWGWGRVPGLLNFSQRENMAQKVWISYWFEDNGVQTLSQDCAWYRRDFIMPEGAAGRRVVLTFTILQTRAVVFVDGKKAAVCVFPGGEADITPFVKPGTKQSLVLFVTAYPLSEKTLDYNAPDRARETVNVVKCKGLTGDVYLDILPTDARVLYGTVRTSVQEGRVTFIAETERLPAGTYRLSAEISDAVGKHVRRFSADGLSPDAAGAVRFTAPWKDPLLWDTHTSSNLYTCTLSLSAPDGRLIDTLPPFRFGFRDVRIDGRDLKLNGTTLHLRALFTPQINADAGIACKETALKACRRLRAAGFNFIIAGNYNFSPGAVSYMDGLLEACDETGMLFSFSLPHIRDFKMKLDRPDVAARYRALTEWTIRRARNHPSVITYAMNHNATGYCGDMNPLRIDGRYEPRPTAARSFRNRSQARMAAAIAKSIDPTRPVYHHESGNLDDFHTVNIYLNWAPIQERSDWLEHWSEEGVKPLFFVEWGMPHISSWSSYRGPLFIWRNPAYQSLWASEFAAAFRGDAAYEGDTPETAAALGREASLWAKNKPFSWSQLNAGLRALTNNYQKIQSLYMADNWRSHRTWGITAMLPWDQSAFYNRTRSVSPWTNPARFTNLKRPGIVPDLFIPGGFESDPSEDSSWAPSSVGQTLLRWNGPDCAFIGGDSVFTDKRRHFRPGEVFQKRLVILNDRRVPQKVIWTCALHDLDGKTHAEQHGETQIAPGGRTDVPVSWTLPGTAGKMTLDAVFTFEGNVVQRDTFALQSLEPAPVTEIAGLRLHDPEGLTAKAFDRLGIPFTRITCEDARTNEAPLVIGRGALTRELFDTVLVPFACRGGKILMFEQSKAALETVGFRVQQHGLRTLFPRYRDAGLSKYLTPSRLQDWAGESTLLPPYSSNIEDIEIHYPTETWAGFTATRVWRCRNRGMVSGVLIEKPSVGDWRALVDGGFDLQYAPLLDWGIKSGRITFCQLDVTARTIADPAADDLVKALTARLADRLPYSKNPSALGQRAFLAARDYDVGLNHDSKTSGSGWFIVSSGATRPADFAARIAKGGRALCLGLSAKEVAAWSPVPLAVTETNQCLATRIEQLPPELNGLSNADWSWHGTMDFAAFTKPVRDGNNAIRIVHHGKGVIVFWQVPPWKIDAESRPYLRSSRRRADMMLARLLANLGCVSNAESIRYLDAPVAEDDPYRYYRW